MKLVDINWNPSDRQLKQFGWASLALLPLAGWGLLGFPLRAAWSPAAGWTMGTVGLVGLALAILAMLKPRAIRPLFVALSIVSFPIGLVVGELTLLIIYCLIFAPIGAIFRLVGRDALARRSGKGAASYWTTKSTPASTERYFHQY